MTQSYVEVKSAAFPAVSLSLGSPEWQALPAWNMMLLAQRPLGILLPDISQVDALVAVSRARVRHLPPP